MDVVCTAGHVDHGKSALVRALTGMEPDRFAEERRRGLTIDLGFAWTELGDGDSRRTVAFVDLPGHERFIANMLAGAGPLEVALLVVAADEGWMPQTQEHIDILDVLQVRAGVVAVTKTDLVGADEVTAVTSDIEQRLKGTTLVGATIVPVSASAGSGLDVLTEQLVEVLRQRPPADDGRVPRLWVDRAFSIKGAGTVVTGTLTAGVLRVGDEVAVVPGSTRARVRGLQSLQRAVDHANAGDRVAVNLTGVELDVIGRGQLLTFPRNAFATTTMDVGVRALRTESIGRRGAWHLHAGSGRWIASIRPLSGNAITGEGFARIELEPPAPLQPGDRFVLRNAGSNTSVGGGLVLDVDPPRVRGSQQRQARSEALQRRRAALAVGDRPRLLAEDARDRGVIDAEAALRLGLPADHVAATARAAGLVPLGSAWAHAPAAAAWSSAVVDELQHYHRSHPLARIAPRSVATAAATAAGCPPAYVDELITILVRLGRVVGESGGVRHPDHAVALSPQDDAARTALLAALRAGRFSPPGLKETVAASGVSPALLRELQASGALVQLAADIALPRDSLDEAGEVLRRQFGASAFTAAQAKQAWATSRKFAVPLLEELDRRGITRRDGDIRYVR